MTRLLNASLMLFLLTSGGQTERQCAETILFSEGKSYNTKYFTTSDGIMLRYLSSGQGPALIFQPGWMMPAEIFKFQLDQLSSSFHVIVLDPRGQGLSEESPDNNDVGRRARDIYELIEFEKIDSFILAGWSLGVLDVLYYADKFGTDKLNGLVLLTARLLLTMKECSKVGRILSMICRQTDRNLRRVLFQRFLKMNKTQYL